jgi:hypothetical protein
MIAFRSDFSLMLTAVMLVAIMATAPAHPVRADENRWGFGSALGFTAGTVNDTVFTLGFNLDYYIDRNFVGFGLIHADLDRGAGRSRIDRNDTSWYLPIGMSLEYQAVRNVALTSTLIVNLHDINLAPSLPEQGQHKRFSSFWIQLGSLNALLGRSYGNVPSRRFDRFVLRDNGRTFGQRMAPFNTQSSRERV